MPTARNRTGRASSRFRGEGHHRSIARGGFRHKPGSYNIVISRKDVVNKLQEIAICWYGTLGIDRDWLTKRFEAAKEEPKYESIVVKEVATESEYRWVLLNQYEISDDPAEQVPRRHFFTGILAAHASGYVARSTSGNCRGEIAVQ